MRYLPLFLLLATPAMCQVSGENEPNDDASRADALGPGHQIDATLGPTDSDWYSFTINTAQDLLAWTSPGEGTAAGDTVIALYDQAQNLVVEVDDGARATHGFYSCLTLGNLAPGSYFLEVRGFQGTRVGSYTIDLVTAGVGTIVPRVAPRPTFSGPEPNDPRLLLGLATASGLGTRNEGSIAIGGAVVGGLPQMSTTTGADYDFYSFSVATEQIVTIDTGGPVLLGGSAISDTVLFLVDGFSRVVAVNDDDGLTGYSRIRRLLSPGIYYAVVSGRSPVDSGTYSLQILGTPSLSNASASVIRHPHTTAPMLCNTGLVGLGVRSDLVNNLAVQPEQPILGSTFCLELSGPIPRPSSVFAAWATGAGQFDLTGILSRWAGCNADIGIDPSSVVQVLQPDGVSGDPVTLAVQIPWSTSVIGQRLEVQAVVDDLGAQSTPTLSNRCTVIAGVVF